MSHRPCPRPRSRPGISLLEVLVAIFIVSIGILTLLSLFLLGGAKMGQALKDDRCSQTALAADGFLRAHWRTVLEHHRAYKLGNATVDRIDPIFWAMDDPNATTFPPANPVTGPSYPVMVDPLGYLARATGSPGQLWLAGNTAGIPRRNVTLDLNGVPTPMSEEVARQTCCLLDDISFGPDGKPLIDPSAPNAITRQGRYNWSAIIQRPINNMRDVAEIKVMVFDGRVPLVPVPDEEIPINLLPTSNPITPGTRGVTFTAPIRGPAQVALVRKGGWLFDGTVQPGPTGIRHANFYRIVGVVEQVDPANPNNLLYVVDLDKEITRDDGNPDPYAASIYMFAGLAEVFERPLLKADPAQ